jgi:alpha-L-fucosidase
MKLFTRITIVIFLVIQYSTLTAQQNYQPSPENLEAREWFQNARFGLFIHWGVYSVLGEGEWVMKHQQSQVSTYE